MRVTPEAGRAGIAEAPPRRAWWRSRAASRRSLAVASPTSSGSRRRSSVAIGQRRSPTRTRWQVVLRHGEADLPAFANEIRRREIPLAAPPQPASVYTPDVQAVNRVPVVTLWAASGLLALAALAIFGQALAREMLARGDDLPTLRALGMSRAALTAVSMAKAVLVGAGGAAAAVGVAVLASPLMPLGLARIAEPDPGLAADWLVLGIGALATLVAVSAVSILPARRAARASKRPGAVVATPGLRRSPDAVARAGLPTSMTSGVRLATRASGPAEPVPVRTAFVGTCFVDRGPDRSSGVRVQLETPRTGATTVRLLLGRGRDRGPRQPRRPGGLSAARPRRGHWKGRVFASVRVEGLLLGAFASEGPPPSIIKGRSPEGPDEVALDPKTLDRLHKGLSDAVRWPVRRVRTLRLRRRCRGECASSARSPSHACRFHPTRTRGKEPPYRGRPVIDFRERRQRRAIPDVSGRRGPHRRRSRG